MHPSEKGCNNEGGEKVLFCKMLVFMQGTNLLIYYLFEFVLYFNAIYVFMIIAFDLVITPYL